MAGIATSFSLLIGFLELLTSENEISLKLMEITQQIQNERYYHTIIYVRHDSTDFQDMYDTDKIFKYLMENNNHAIINFKGNTSYYLWKNFNRRCMAIAHLNGNEAEDKQLLKILWKTLKRNVLTRLILLVKESNNDKYIGNILEFCIQNKALKVIAIKETFNDSNEYYRPIIYPKFEESKEKIKENVEKGVLYPNHVRNMHEHPLRLVMNKVSTKTYVLRIENGNIILGGYAGHFFTEFARKHNATLTFPNYSDLNSELFLDSLDKLVENGTYDVSTEPTFNLQANDLVYSDIYDYMDWCFMVPMEKAIAGHYFYFLIYDMISLSLIFAAFITFSLILALTYLAKGQHITFQECLINIYVLNGLLGQSYKMEPKFSSTRNFIYMLICLAGLIFNTTFVTYLQTFNASPPTENVIKTMDDIRVSGMKILVFKKEFALLDTYQFADAIRPFAILVDSYADYYALRDNFDTRYIYPVPSAQWTLYEQQQKFFAKPRFRLSDVCVVKMFPMNFPLQENSPFEEAMNTMIGLVNQAGIVTHWKSVAFREALQLKRISLMDPSVQRTFEPMKLEDMQLLMFVFIVATLLVCMCFYMELYWPHRGVIRRKVMYKLRNLFDRNINKY